LEFLVEGRTRGPRDGCSILDVCPPRVGDGGGDCKPPRDLGVTGEKTYLGKGGGRAVTVSPVRVKGLECELGLLGAAGGAESRRGGRGRGRETKTNKPPFAKEGALLRSRRKTREAVSPGGSGRHSFRPKTGTPS